MIGILLLFLNPNVIASLYISNAFFFTFINFNAMIAKKLILKYRSKK